MQTKDMDKYIADVIQTNLHLLPDRLRLMYLNYSAGMSVNDVCALQADAYQMINDMPCVVICNDVVDKIVPISWDLYKMMRKYISSTVLKANDYVFGDTHSCADAGAFCSQIKKYFRYCANVANLM